MLHVPTTNVIMDFFRTASLLMIYLPVDLVDLRCSETKTLIFPTLTWQIQTFTCMFVIDHSLVDSSPKKYLKVSLVVLDPIPWQGGGGGNFMNVYGIFTNQLS